MRLTFSLNRAILSNEDSAIAFRQDDYRYVNALGMYVLTLEF